jgi:hypothetical protein
MNEKLQLKGRYVKELMTQSGQNVPTVIAIEGLLGG